MLKFIFLIILFQKLLFAQDSYTEKDIKKLIGRTIILGFNDSTFSKNTSIYNDIKKYNLGGVILFDKYYKSKKKKNIKNPKQLKKLISNIQKNSNYRMFISIDQEGGWVSRLNPKNGFRKTPKASAVSKKGTNYAKKVYKNLASDLAYLGINLNFAPVVDLNINSKNRVIVFQGRSYSKNPQTVIKYSKIFIDEMKKKDVISVLKHFPGHGSSVGDSHKGFVDITNTWKRKELIPYEKLIESKHVNMIMTAHVYNKNLDKKYPATLSHNINTFMLKEKMNYQGLIISDDLQMKAISNHYDLEDTVTLAINSGVNILLFGNHINNKNIKLETIVNTIYRQIQRGNIKLSKILESNRLINNTL